MQATGDIGRREQRLASTYSVGIQARVERLAIARARRTRVEPEPWIAAGQDSSHRPGFCFLTFTSRFERHGVPIWRLQCRLQARPPASTALARRAHGAAVTSSARTK